MKLPDGEIVKWSLAMRSRRLVTLLEDLEKGERIQARVVRQYPDGWTLLSVRGYRIMVNSLLRLAKGRPVEISVRGWFLELRECSSEADRHNWGAVTERVGDPGRGSLDVLT